MPEARRSCPPAAPVDGLAGNDGALFQFSHLTNTMLSDVIIKRPLSPGTATVFYDELAGPAGADNFSNLSEPVIYTKIHNSNLVTGP